jgi:hypothetical protein
VSRRAALLLIGCLCVMIATLVWSLRDIRRASPTAEPNGAVKNMRQPAPLVLPPPPDPAIARSLAPRAEGRVLPPEAEALARSLNAPDETAEHDVQTLSSLVDLFRRANGGAIPAGGLNEEITEQLSGKNPRHFAVLPPDCPGLDGAGRLLDRWGKPYFLHPLSREILEIRSAGPDGKFGAADDVVVGDEAGAEIRR